MTFKNSFRVTFHVSHPSIAAQEVEIGIDMPSHFSQSVGCTKKTKSGKVLKGVYTKTNVSFRIHKDPLDFNEHCIESIINENLNSLDSSYLKLLNDTGGECHYLLGVYSSENVMFEFSSDLLAHLAKSKMKVKFDFYGGED
jgi:hypothetical protein